MSKTLNNISEAGPRIGGPFLVGQILSSRLKNSNDGLSIAYRQHLADAKKRKGVQL